MPTNLRSIKIARIGVVGLWHLGSVYSAALAELGHTVVAFDRRKEVVRSFERGELPVVEEGLAALTKKNRRAGRLFYTSAVKEVASCALVWLTIDTPCRNDNAPDTSSLSEAFRSLTPHFVEGVTIVVSSQVPVGSGEAFKRLIQSIRPSLRFSYLYQPENLQLGRALSSFFTPARVVIGGESRENKALLERVFVRIKAPKLFMNVASAEMVKHALNSFLATSLSFIYDISDLCELYGADVLQVSRALKSDARIGPAAYLDSSIGFSGATLGRDLSTLLLKAKEKNLTLPVIAGAREKNERRWRRVLSLLEDEIPNLRKSSIGFLGVAYKPKTSTTRDSLALKVMKALRPRVGHISAYDPLVPKEVIEKAGDYRFCRDPSLLARGASALVLMTSSEEYKKLDFKKIAARMKQPKLFFDAKNFLWESEEAIKKAGMRYRGIGRGNSHYES